MTPTREHAAWAERHFRDPAVARAYDRQRFESAAGRRRNRRKLAAVDRAIRAAADAGDPIRTALDAPCGTGRLFPLLGSRGIRFVGADLSLEMMAVARAKAPAAPCVAADAESLPFSSRALDAVFCIRFLTHVDPDSRRRILAEMARVSRRWLLVDFRHRYTIRYLLRRARRALGFATPSLPRFSRRGLRDELAVLGLSIEGIFPTRPWLPFLSDKWVVLASKRSATGPPTP